MNEENSSLAFQLSTRRCGQTARRLSAENIEKWSRSRLKKLIDDGDVLVNEKQSKASYKLSENDSIEIELTETPVESFEPEDIPLEIIYEDEFLAVINKPSGMVVHPGAGISSGTLANALAYKFKVQSSKLKVEDDRNSQIDDIKSQVGIVHRLDKDTSGLMVVAKTRGNSRSVERTVSGKRNL